MQASYRPFLAAPLTPKEELIARIQKKHAELKWDDPKRTVLERCLSAFNHPNPTYALGDLCEYVRLEREKPRNFTQLSSCFFGAIQKRIGVQAHKTDTEKLVEEAMNLLESRITHPAIPSAEPAPGINAKLI